MTRRATAECQADHHLTRWGRARRPWAALLAVALVVSACGGDDDDGATSGVEDTIFETAEAEGGEAFSPVEALADSGDDAVTATEAFEADSDAAAVDGDVTSGDTTGAQSGAGQTAGVTAADLNRQIIFTATVEVDVDNVAAAGVDAVAAIQRVGGFVFGQESTGGAEPRSVFVFKVRPADFDEALAALSGIGELRNQVISADDVTERVVDLESRIQVAELGVERLRTALESATSLEDYAQLERLLLDRESELEVMRGQIRTLSDQVDLATITLVLTQDRIENNLQLDVSFYEEHNGGLSCPGRSNTSVESGTDLTICFELLNVGDQALTDLTLTDTGLGIEAGPDTTDSGLVEVFGSLGDTLQPGQRIILAHELTPEREIWMRTVAGGRPVAMEGGDPAGPPVSTISNNTLDVTPSSDAPGFEDGFEQGKTVVAGIWSAVRVTVGFILPLLVLLPFLLGLGWLLRTWRRRPGRKQPASTTAFGGPPPPAPHTNVGEPTAAAPAAPATEGDGSA